MNPLAQQALGAIIRHVLTIAAGYLVARGVWTQEEAIGYVTALALVVVGVGWSLWQKYRGRVKLLTALSGPAQTEQSLDADVADGYTPSVMTAPSVIPTVLGVLLACCLFAGCASSRGPLLQADRTIHATLAGVQDSVDALCDAKLMTSPDCVSFNRALVPALQAGDSFNRAVRAERVGALGPLIEAIGKLTHAVTLLVPADRRGELLTRLNNLFNTAFQEAK